MNTMSKSVLAGFGATIVLSIIMILKSAMGVMPAMNAIAMLTHMAHHMLGTPASPAVGWIIHFLIGTLLWGILFSLFYGPLPGASAVPKALSFSVVAWLLMMVIVMPMAGQGFFALHIGVMAAVATLVLHLIWGLSLGLLYQALGATNQGKQHAGQH